MRLSVAMYFLFVATLTTSCAFARVFSDTGTQYHMEARIESTTGTVTLGDGTITKVVFSFGSIAKTVVGVATNNSGSDFDNFKVAPAPTQTILHQTDFSTGATGYTVTAGTWNVVSQAYVGDAGAGVGAQAVSKTPVTSGSAIIEADLKRNSNGDAWIVFDYTDALNFKFAGFSTSPQQWEIGLVSGGTVTNSATAAGTFTNGTVYHVKVLLQGANTAAIVYQNSIKARFTFTGLSNKPIALGVRTTTTNFDNILIYTLTTSLAPGQTPPAVPPPTQSPAPPDGPITDLTTVPFYYHLNDHLGSTRILTDQTGAVIASYEYFPFGEAKAITGCSAFNDQRFTGKLLDNESTLQYFGARYLSNDLTRFTTVDPSASSFNSNNPQSWNRYSYALNNPVAYKDDDGRATGWAEPLEEFLTSEDLQEMGKVGGVAVLVVGSIHISYDFGQAIKGPVQIYWTDLWYKPDSSSIPTAQDLTSEPYNRRKHYGNTPTKKDREALGAGTGEVANHEPALVKRYYDGDPKADEKPGKDMTPEERRASANDRGRMNKQTKSESDQQGGEMAKYSRGKKAELKQQQ